MLLRAVALELRVATRSLGVWPWLGMLGMCAAARWQEPVFLRTQQIELVWHAIPVLGCMQSLLFTLGLVSEHSFSSGRIQHMAAPFLALSVLTLTTCVVTGAVGVVLDLALGTLPRPTIVAGSMTYPLTRLAPALALVPGLLRTRLPLAAVTAVLLMVASAMILLLGYEPLGSVSSLRTLGVSALATAGSLGVTTFLCDTRRFP